MGLFRKQKPEAVLPSTDSLSEAERAEKALAARYPDAHIYPSIDGQRAIERGDPEQMAKLEDLFNRARQRHESAISQAPEIGGSEVAAEHIGEVATGPVFSSEEVAKLRDGQGLK